ncbi:mechanosensitive ion channel family protein [Lactobacillus sp. PV037]|uniref:mechanosensitive ion channel family protein n=1 Tax=Lactobacillus sp. PV037 TaxID=2594496 RepID=UPI0022400327|nr:mechanosensitive ion channel family protein [Lactobacillus sp. PV037]
MNTQTSILKNITSTSKKIKLQTIDWNDITHNLTNKLFQLVILSIIFLILWRVGSRVLSKYLLHNKHFQRQMTGRKRTFTQLAMNIFRYILLFFYLYEILSIIGLPVGTLLASAGIVSLALGMGAQGFVSDLVNGLVILSEGQFDVGDIVNINQYTGTVLAFGLRTTRLKNSDGTIIYIPNRQITVVENVTRGGVGFNIDLQIASSSDVKLVRHAINLANKELKNKFPSQIKKGPEIRGLIEQNGDSLTYQVHFQVVSGSQTAIKAAYFSAYIKNLQELNITLT